MKHVDVFRGPSTDEGTFGTWQFDGREWVSMELPDRDNKPNLSRILAGTYICQLEPTHLWSPRPDGLLYHVLDVPGHQLIKIHAANWAGDVTLHWHSDLLGCLAIGNGRAELTPMQTGKPQQAITGTREALAELMDLLAGETFELQIHDPE